MARLKRGAVPSLRWHKATNQAIVELSGQTYYCGPFGSKTALAEYDRHVAEWLARGRRPLVEFEKTGGVTLVELAASFRRHAESYYRKNGSITNEVKMLVVALRVASNLYGEEPADDFGPLKLAAVQQTMIKAGWCRRQINKQVGRIVRMFSWGVSQELVKADTAQALREVPGLRKGRCEARESAPVLPVDDAIVNQTLEHLPPIVAGMVRLQRLTGMRPEEVCGLRPCDVDTSGTVWTYRPQSHKTEHQGRERVIFIGPKGQGILRPYLLRDKTAYCFVPSEGERKRREAAHEARVTPLNHGNRPGSNRKSSPKRSPGGKYDTASYRRAIHRACRAAMPEELREGPDKETLEAKGARESLAAAWLTANLWAPNRLRHSAATEIRKKFGLEAAQVTLGHSAADVTQIYAERDLEKAAAVMAQVG